MSNKIELTEEQQQAWRMREQLRMSDGTYKLLPQYTRSYLPTEADHFVHLSDKKPGMLAYTANELAGHFDRQKIISVRNYVAEHFPQYVEHEVWQQHIQMMERELMPAAKVRVQLLRSTEEIVWAYTKGPGFDSCMRYDAKDFASRPIHPASVYGESDLALAVMVDVEHWPEGASIADVSADKAIIARALCWPEKMYRGRIFAGPESISQHFARMLEEIGYCRKDYFGGAKLRYIEHSNGRIVCPYLDVGDAVDVQYHDGKTWLVITSGGGMAAKNTDGFADDAEEECVTPCYHCEDMTDDDDMSSVRTSVGTRQFCSYCASNHTFFCHGEDRHYYDEDFKSYEVDGQLYGERYCERNFSWCEHTETYTSGDTVEVVVGVRRTMYGLDQFTETWCIDAAEDDATYCEHLGTWFEDGVVEFLPVLNDEGAEVMLPDILLHQCDVMLIGGTLYFANAVPPLYEHMLEAAE